MKFIINKLEKRKINFFCTEHDSKICAKKFITCNVVNPNGDACKKFN